MTRRAVEVFKRYRFVGGMVSWIGLKQVPLLYDRSAAFWDHKVPIEEDDALCHRCDHRLLNDAAARCIDHRSRDGLR